VVQRAFGGSSFEKKLAQNLVRKKGALQNSSLPLLTANAPQRDMG
jgi:hypothetical protein